jgi:hypothetical protein
LRGLPGPARYTSGNDWQNPVCRVLVQTLLSRCCKLLRGTPLDLQSHPLLQMIAVANRRFQSEVDRERNGDLSTIIANHASARSSNGQSHEIIWPLQTRHSSTSQLGTWSSPSGHGSRGREPYQLPQDRKHFRSRVICEALSHISNFGARSSISDKLLAQALRSL